MEHLSKMHRCESCIELETAFFHAKKRPLFLLVLLFIIITPLFEGEPMTWILRKKKMKIKKSQARDFRHRISIMANHIRGDYARRKRVIEMENWMVFIFRLKNQRHRHHLTALECPSRNELQMR